MGLCNVLRLAGVTLALAVISATASATPILGGYGPSTQNAIIDNCMGIDNPDQRDTDGDGYGNMCDPDLNNDGAINFLDLGILKSVFFSSNADADLNGDGAVNFLDLGIMKSMFFGAPGPNVIGVDTSVGVPEPGTLLLLLAGIIGLRSTRKS